MIGFEIGFFGDAVLYIKNDHLKMIQPISATDDVSINKIKNLITDLQYWVDHIERREQSNNLGEINE